MTTRRQIQVTETSQVQFTEVNAETAGQRLDNFLLRLLKGCPKSRVYRMIRKGEVRINRKRAKPDSRLAEGDLVRIPPVRLAEREEPPSPSQGLRRLLEQGILHEDEHFLVVNKPAGLAVHGGSGVRLGMIEALRQMHARWSALELVHRLDRDTSGCMVLSKNTQFLREINKQFKEKSVTKIYLALVQGAWPDSLRQVEAKLQKNQLESGERMVRVDETGEAGKPALTRFRVVERFGGLATLVEAVPVTGRTHQIRVHCRHGGHPILGDTKYGNRSGEPVQGIRRLCLHATALEFRFPPGASPQRFQAALDADFEAILKLLRKQKNIA